MLALRAFDRDYIQREVMQQHGERACVPLRMKEDGVPEMVYTALPHGL